MSRGIVSHWLGSPVSSQKGARLTSPFFVLSPFGKLPEKKGINMAHKLEDMLKTNPEFAFFEIGMDFILAKCNWCKKTKEYRGIFIEDGIPNYLAKKYINEFLDAHQHPVPQFLSDRRIN